MTTSSDKTKKKLLDSMRMSKQGSAATPAKASAPAAASTPAKAAPAKAASKAPAKKVAAKPKPAPKTAAKKAATGSYGSREARATLIADTFESGRRIWPD
jgi:hypothetical protein